MDDERPLVLQERRCANPECGARFWICDRCDRCHRYCGEACRRRARRLSHREANHRYQDAPRGRRTHSLRQRRYRHRRRLAANKVTDHSSPTASACGNVELWPGHAVEQIPQTRRCLLCGRPASESGSAVTVPAAAVRGSPPMSDPELQTSGPLSRDEYVVRVLGFYLELPQTPDRASTQDQQCAQWLFTQGVPLEMVETALGLASLRRLLRPALSPPLPRIRSLAYFQPVLEELRRQPAPAGYLDYLRRKLHAIAPRPAKGQR